jgi:hypothetical protein
MRSLLGCGLAIFLSVPAYPVTLPLKASANKRYLVDQSGIPVLLVNDTAQGLIGLVSVSDAATYFTTRESQGFNATWINMPCAGYNGCPSNGSALDGTKPFTSGTGPANYDISTPNPAYWAEVDAIIALAAAHNMTVLFDPMETGSFLTTMENNGAVKSFNYGVFIGNRYKNTPNIVYQWGNDCNSCQFTPADTNLAHQLFAGIASVDTSHLQSIELFQPYASDAIYSNLGTLLTFDSAYTYTETPGQVLAAVNFSPTLPVYLGESYYEGENVTGQLPGPAGPKTMRQIEYWTVTSGAFNVAYGSSATDPFAAGWQSKLATTGATQVAYTAALFNSVAWWLMTPDQSSSVVTAGYGTLNVGNQNLTTANYCSTSWITDGSLAMVYCPTAATLTVNMAKFSGPVNVRWYDPSNGTFTDYAGSHSLILARATSPRKQMPIRMRTE